MNPKQKEAIDLALSGHSIFITGQAGTGKSYILTEIIKELRGKGINVQLTCTTGIACTTFPKNQGAMTIHRWSGMDDCRYTADEICSIIQNSPKHAETLKRIKSTDLLIIDEVSMLSVKMFEQLEKICSLKDPKSLFGGMQLITSGDFYQLPPVANVLYNDDGELCFNSIVFGKKLTHKVILNEVIRQDDPELVGVIQRVSTGTISQMDIDFIETLKRPLESEADVKLFSNNLLIDNYNRSKILEFSGELYKYKAKDTGEIRYLNKITAPSTLWVKIGCPVILLRNLSQTLVNGLIGTVVGVEEDGIIVHFPTMDVTSKVSKFLFTGNDTGTEVL